jgi:hypothetical protein
MRIVAYGGTEEDAFLGELPITPSPEMNRITTETFFPDHQA